MLGTLTIHGPLDTLAEIAADLHRRYPDGISASTAPPQPTAHPSGCRWTPTSSPSSGKHSTTPDRQRSRAGEPGVRRVAPRIPCRHARGWLHSDTPVAVAAGSEPETRPDDRGARASRIPEQAN